MSKGKSVIISGASSGIGREMALQLAAKGWQVGLLARRENLLHELCQLIAAEGGKSFFACCDVTQASSVQEASNELMAEMGVPELLIANAGISHFIKAINFDLARANAIYQTNVLGVLHLIQAVLPGMLKQRRGHIVGISSLASYRSFPFNHVYCASKAALNAQLEGLRIELLPYNIKVSTICPGFIRTGLTQKNRFKMPFLLEAPVAANKILSAIEKKKKVYNFPWQTYCLVRLARFIPDALLAKVNR